MTTDDQKRAAAEKAIEMIEPGMAVGLGTGSTAEHFVRELAVRVRDGLNIRATSTSLRTEALARELGIQVVPLDELGPPDLTVDGADEVDRDLRLIKGGGGALLREKVVAAASKHMVVIADWSKRVDALGLFPLPIEIVTFAPQTTIQRIASIVAGCGCRGNLIRLRGGDRPFVTDQGNYIADVGCEFIPDPEELARALSGVPGIVDHGLFLGMCQTLILGHTHGLEIVTR
ncbi:MAG: ribose-5-phosphate isomerase RpiA [Alphaproteobacteria bacterium]|nr:ribose-5-phosphate isomerase RpiA [Alphaproteobacteria bacterium]